MLPLERQQQVSRGPLQVLLEIAGAEVHAVAAFSSRNVGFAGASTIWKIYFHYVFPTQQPNAICSHRFFFFISLAAMSKKSVELLTCGPLVSLQACRSPLSDLNVFVFFSCLLAAAAVAAHNQTRLHRPKGLMKSTCLLFRFFSNLNKAKSQVSALDTDTGFIPSAWITSEARAPVGIIHFSFFSFLHVQSDPSTSN